MYEDAVRLMQSDDLEAFNIHREDKASKERYGDDPFGQGCLLARRLIESNVRTVEGATQAGTRTLTTLQRCRCCAARWTARSVPCLMIWNV